jgi:hypothetical protein
MEKAIGWCLAIFMVAGTAAMAAIVALVVGTLIENNRTPGKPVPCHCQKCEAKCCEVSEKHMPFSDNRKPTTARATRTCGAIPCDCDQCPLEGCKCGEGQSL